MEHQVAKAALAVISPTTDGATRTAASQFLEQWTLTSESWSVYAKWLQSFRNPSLLLLMSNGSTSSSTSSEMIGMQLLCLTMLVNKVRRELPYGTTPNDSILAIRNEVWAFLLQPPGQFDYKVLGHCCVCTAALAARCGNLQELITMCCQSAVNVLPDLALKLLASVPQEVEACADLTTPQVTAGLWPYLEGILDTVRRALSDEETIVPALDALRSWATICHVSLSHINTPTYGGTECLLPILIQLLSQPEHNDAEVLQVACDAMTEAILNPSDSTTSARQNAVAMMLNSIGQGFIAAPFAQVTKDEWDDAAHGLATLVCTLVTEEIDDICVQPAEACLNLLLQIQAHPRPMVSIIVLECWLTVQEVPMASRHDNWKAPLFVKVLDGLVPRIAYPPSFTTWEEELDYDQSEFDELRRLVADVMVSCYFLLRVDLIQKMVSLILTSFDKDWTVIESALFCLCKVSREACARVKSRATGSTVSRDRDVTAQQLLQLIEHLCGTHPVTAAESAARQHPLVLAAVANFIGAYSPAWNVLCSTDALVQLLGCLRVAVSVPRVSLEAAKAFRSVCVGCSSKLLSVEGSLLRETMEASLSSDDEESMSIVAEGITRLAFQMKDESTLRQMLGVVMEPLLQKLGAALNAVPSDAAVLTPEAQVVVDSLAKYLHVIQEIVRFCDSNTDGDVFQPIADVMNAVWPYLERTAQMFARDWVILGEVVSIHLQLLKNAPELVKPHFQQTINFVVTAFETTKHPRTLEYVSSAVELLGPSNSNEGSEQSFADLLGHVTTITLTYVTTETQIREVPDLICAFFELDLRYVIYCPSALVGRPHFTSMVGFAVECLSACEGERESTRSALNFLGHLFGWRQLRLPVTASSALENAASCVDEQLGQHGETITRACVSGLSGGPQMLWPAYADCLFAIISHLVGTNASSPVVEENTIAHQWVYKALSECTTSSTPPSPTQSPLSPQQQQQQQQQRSSNRLSSENYQQIVSLLMGLARDGTKSKPKAKMLLTDFAKICKGEMTAEALLSYTFQQ
jgi:hypothetical protein